MSTKLYDGILLTFTPDQFWQSVATIRETIEATFEELNNELTIQYMKSVYIDSIMTNRRNRMNGTELDADKADDTLFFKALRKWQQEDGFFKKKLRCDVQIFEPLEDGRILGYVFNNNESQYVKNLLELPFVEDFGYWNNTDKPDELTEDEWSDRCEAWNVVLDRNFFITGTGITIGLPAIEERTFVTLPENDFMTKLNDAINDEEQSWQKTLSLHLVQNTVSQKMVKAMHETGDKSDLSKVMGVIHTAMDVVNDASVLPVSVLPSLSRDDLILKNVNELPEPVIDEAIVKELAEKVEEQLEER